MDQFPKSPEKDMKFSERKVSANKYTIESSSSDPVAAKVKFRIKGLKSDGVLYQGQQLIEPCRNCPKP